jgi:hypothetical protein
MKKLRAEEWLRQRRLTMALGALLVTLAKAPACFAADPPAPPGSAQRAAADCAKVAPVGAQPQGKAEASGSSRAIVTWVAGGVGVAGLTTGVVYELMASSNNRKAADLCRSGGDSRSCSTAAEHARHQQLVDAAQSDRQVGLVALSVGGAALVTTAVLLLTGHAEEHPDDAPAVSVGLVDGGWGATLAGRF